MITLAATVYDPQINLNLSSDCGVQRARATAAAEKHHRRAFINLFTDTNRSARLTFYVRNEKAANNRPSPPRASVSHFNLTARERPPDGDKNVIKIKMIMQNGDM